MAHKSHGIIEVNTPDQTSKAGLKNGQKDSRNQALGQLNSVRELKQEFKEFTF